MRLNWTICVVSTALLTIVSGCQRQSEPTASKNEKATLIVAASSGDLSRVQKLLREGADPNEHTNSGKTALHYAAQSKNVSGVVT